jgi:hypothetical protein
MVYYRTTDIDLACIYLDYCVPYKVPSKIIARAMRGDTKPMYDMVDHLKALRSLSRNEWLDE